MKRSELKEMILTAIKEDEGKIDESFVDEISKNLRVAEADEDEDIEIEDIEVEDAEVETGDDKGEIDVKANAEVGITGEKKTVQDNLEAALIAAKELGDQKLIDQIGNSITFFTRTHVVGKDDNVNEMDIDLEEQEINESFEKSRMLRIAGIKK